MLRDRHGIALAVASLGEDITEPGVVWAEQRQLSAAVEHAFAAILITDPNGTITYVNPA